MTRLDQSGSVVRDAETDAAFLQSLREQLAADIVVTDRDLLESLRTDQSGWAGAGVPLCAVSPRSTDEVATVVRLAAASGIPIVTRGAGSGLSGGATAIDGCIVLSTRRMASILEIDPVDRVAIVQPGVITGELRAAVGEAGLFYPPDPGSVAFCSIGGNAATNAGGMCCVKYGVTGDFVRALEVVLADGSVLRTGTRSVKGVAGYDLTGLFVGSEGTLGVITEITVSLVPKPSAPATVVATFASLADAGSAVAAVLESGHTPSLMEIIDHSTLVAIDDFTGMGVSDGAAAMLLLQSDTATAAADGEQLAALCLEFGAVDAVQTDDPDEGEMLLQARRQALPALERLGDWLLDDVSVPPTRLVEMIEQIQDVAAHTGLTIGVFGHAGDGNLHPTIIYDRSDADQVARTTEAFDAIVDAALRLGGTATGEHGVGRLKTGWLATELSGVSTTVHHRIKDSLDPAHLFNPGVGLPTRPTPDSMMEGSAS